MGSCTDPIGAAGAAGTATEPTLTTALMRSAVRLADRAVISDIECGAVRDRGRPGRVYDVRPMLDEREQPSEWVDMAREALGYAAARGLVVAEPDAPHLLRIVAPLEL